MGHSGPATALTGLPRTIRRHELRLIVPLADIYEIEKRGEFSAELIFDNSQQRSRISSDPLQHTTAEYRYNLQDT